jgi:hypothetical protein
VFGLPQGGIQDGPEVDDPAQEEEPEDTRQDELDDRHEQASLKQLPQAGNEEATERCYDVARRPLSRHVASASDDIKPQHPSCLLTLGHEPHLHVPVELHMLPGLPEIVHCTAWHSNSPEWCGWMPAALPDIKSFLSPCSGMIESQARYDMLSIAQEGLTPLRARGVSASAERAW